MLKSCTNWRTSNFCFQVKIWRIWNIFERSRCLFACLFICLLATLKKSRKKSLFEPTCSLSLRFSSTIQLQVYKNAMLTNSTFLSCLNRQWQLLELAAAVVVSFVAVAASSVRILAQTHNLGPLFCVLWRAVDWFLKDSWHACKSLARAVEDIIELKWAENLGPHITALRLSLTIAI